MGYEVDFNTLVAPVFGISNRHAFTVAVDSLVNATVLADGGPRLNAVGARVALNFSFKLASPLAKANTLALHLPGIDACASSNVAKNDIIEASLVYLDNGVSLHITPKRTLSRGSMVVPLDAGLVVSDAGVKPDDVSLEILQSNESAPLARTGLIEGGGRFAGIGAFLSARVGYYAVPSRDVPRGGESISIELNFTYSVALSRGDIVELTLPAFGCIFEACNVTISRHLYATGARFNAGIVGNSIASSKNNTLAVNAGLGNATLRLVALKATASGVASGVEILGLRMPQASLRYDEPTVALGCPQCSGAPAAHKSVLSSGHGVAHASIRLAAPTTSNLSKPAVAGEPATVTVTLSISTDMQSGDSVDIGGFDYFGTNMEKRSWTLTIGGTHALNFVGEWHPRTGRSGAMRFIAKTRIAERAPIELIVVSLNEIGPPQAGFAVRSDPDANIFDKNAAETVTWLAPPATVDGARLSSLGRLFPFEPWPYISDTTPVGALVHGSIAFGTGTLAGEPTKLQMNFSLVAPLAKGDGVVLRLATCFLGDGLLEAEYDTIITVDDSALERRAKLEYTPSSGVAVRFVALRNVGSGQAVRVELSGIAPPLTGVASPELFAATLETNSSLGALAPSRLNLSTPLCALLDGRLQLDANSRSGEIGSATLQAKFSTNISTQGVVDFVLPNFRPTTTTSVVVHDGENETMWTNITLNIVNADGNIVNATWESIVSKNATNKTETVDIWNITDSFYLNLRLRPAMPASRVKLTVIDVVYPRIALYENDTSVTVSATDDMGCDISELIPLGRVDALSLTHARVRFDDDALAGELSGIRLDFGVAHSLPTTGVVEFDFGDTGIELNTTWIRPQSISSTPQGVIKNATWAVSTLHLTTTYKLAAGTALSVHIDKRGGFTPPTVGFSSDVSMMIRPLTVALKYGDSRGGDSEPTPLQSIGPELGAITQAKVAFSEARAEAGKATAEILLSFNTSHRGANRGQLAPGAVVEWHLPDFQAASETVAQALAKTVIVELPLAGKDGANFTAEFSGTCNAIVTLRALNTIDAKDGVQVTIPVDTMVLPKRVRFMRANRAEKNEMHGLVPSVRVKPLGLAEDTMTPRFKAVLQPLCALHDDDPAEIAFGSESLPENEQVDANATLLSLMDKSWWITQTMALKRGQPVSLRFNFRFSTDISENEFVELWLPRFSLSSNTARVSLATSLPAAAGWVATWAEQNDTAGVLLRLNASKGYSSTEAISTIEIKAVRPGEASLYPPTDRLRPFRKDVDGVTDLADDVVAVSTRSVLCPLPPTAVLGVPRFEPAEAGADAEIELAFRTTSSLEPSDQVVLMIPGFSAVTELELGGAHAELFGSRATFDHGAASPLVFDADRIQLGEDASLKHKTDDPTTNADLEFENPELSLNSGLLERVKATALEYSVFERPRPMVKEVYAAPWLSDLDASELAPLMQGSIVPVLVKFDHAVAVHVEHDSSGMTPFYLELDATMQNGTTAVAWLEEYTYDEPTTELRFDYVVEYEHASRDLQPAYSLALRKNPAFVGDALVVAVYDDITISGVPANLTLPLPHGALLRDAYPDVQGEAYKPLRVDGSRKPKVTKIATRKNSSFSTPFGAGEVVDIDIYFDAPVVVRGTPTLRLAHVGNALYTQGGAVQYVDVGVNAVPPLTSGSFYMRYAGVAVGCIDWDASPDVIVTMFSRIGIYKTKKYDLSNLGGILESVSSEPRGGGTRFVFRFHVDAAAEPIDVGLWYECEDLVPASKGAVAKRPWVPQASFRYTARAADRTYHYLDAAGANSLRTPGDLDFIVVASNTPDIDAEVALPLLDGNSTALSEFELRINGTAPYVKKLAPTNGESVLLETGDRVNVSVHFSAPVVVGEPTLRLMLRVDSNMGIALPEVTRRTTVFMIGNGTSELVFEFEAQQGDVAEVLDVDGPAALYFDTDQGALYTSADSFGVRRYALPYPTQDADLHLPNRGERGSLADNVATIAVDGNQPAKVVEVVAINPVQQPGVDNTLGTGDLLIVAVRFNREVEIQRINTPEVSPSETIFGPESEWVTLSLATGRKIGDNVTYALNGTNVTSEMFRDPVAYYQGGSGSKELRFSYIVQRGDDTGGAYLNYAGEDALRVEIAGLSLQDVVSGTASLVLFPRADDIRALNTSSRIVLDYLVAPKIIDNENEIFFHGGGVSRLRGPIAALDQDWQELNYDTHVYTVGDVVRLEVRFTTAVVFNEQEGNYPAVYLDGFDPDWGAVGMVAQYVSGNFSDALRFEWTVPSSNESRGLYEPPSTRGGRLHYRGVRALADSGVVLRRGADGDATLGVMLSEYASYLPRAARSPLLHYYDLHVDAVAPNVVDLALAEASASARSAAARLDVASFSVGDVIGIVASFDRPVVVVGELKLLLNAKGHAPEIPAIPSDSAPVSSSDSGLAYASYVAGSGTTEILFEYNVAAGDAAAPLAHASTQHYCPSGLVRDVDITRPTAMDFVGRNNTRYLSYAMLVRWPAGEICPRTLVGELAAGPLSVKRLAENPTLDADLMLPEPGYYNGHVATTSLEMDAISVATEQPYIVMVTTPTDDGVYGSGAVINIDVTFNVPIVVVGSNVVGRLALNLENGNGAFYHGGNGTATLRFKYYVAFGDTTPLGDYLDYASVSALTFSSTVFTDTANEQGVFCDFPADEENETTRECSYVGVGKLLFGTQPKLELSTKEAITLSNVDTTTPSSIYSASVRRRLVTGSDDGTIVASSLTADLSLEPPGPRRTVVDFGSLVGQGRKIVISAIGLKVKTVFAPSGTYGTGQVVPITVRFEREVNVTGIATLALEVGRADGPAFAILDTLGVTQQVEELEFTYVVRQGDETPDLAYVDKYAFDARDAVIVAIGAGTSDDVLVQELAGLPAPTTLPELDEDGALNVTSDVVINTTEPSIVGIEVPSQNESDVGFQEIYAPGAVLDFSVLFTKPVKRDAVAAGPLARPLELELTGFDDSFSRHASYVDGDETNALTFRHIVLYGDAAAGGLEHGTLLLHGGALFHDGKAETAYSSVTKGDVDLVCDDEASAGLASRSVVIDDNPPRVVLARAAADGSAVDVLGSGDVAFMTISFDAPVHVFSDDDVDETGQPKPGASPICRTCSEDIAYTVFGTTTAKSEDGLHDSPQELGYYAPCYVSNTTAHKANPDREILQFQLVEYPGIIFYVPDNFALTSDLLGNDEIAALATDNDSSRRLLHERLDDQPRRDDDKQDSCAAYPAACHYSLFNATDDIDDSLRRRRLIGVQNYGPMLDYMSSATYAEGDTFDECGCHSSDTETASYHCHIPPSCLLAQLGQAEDSHSPQIGWAADGFPVYGPRGPGGFMMQTCTETGGVSGVDVCLDDCGGYLAEINVDDFKYRYYIIGEYHKANAEENCATPVDPLPSAAYFPFSPYCLKGCISASIANEASWESFVASCTDSVQDGYTAEYEPRAKSSLAVDHSYCTSGVEGTNDTKDEDEDYNNDEHQQGNNETLTGLRLPAGSPPLYADLIEGLLRKEEISIEAEWLPRLALDTRTDGASWARYAGGSGTKHLVFVYEVGSEDSTAALEYIGVSALRGAVFRAPRGSSSAISSNDDVSKLVPADLALPRRGSQASFGGRSSGTPLVMHNAPRAAYLASCTDTEGVISSGQVLDIRIVFNLPVSAGATYELSLSNGDAHNWGQAIDTSGITDVELFAQIEAAEDAEEVGGDRVPRLLLNTGNYAYYLGPGEGGTLRFGYYVREDDAGDFSNGALEAVSPFGLFLRNWVVATEDGAFAVSQLPYARLGIIHSLDEACSQNATDVEFESISTLDSSSSSSSSSNSDSLVIDTSPPRVTQVSLGPTSKWCTEVATRAASCGAGELIELFVEFDATVEVIQGAATFVLLNSGSCSEELAQGVDHHECIGGTAAWDGDSTPQRTLRFVYEVLEGDASDALDVLNATALSGDIRRFATPVSITQVDATLPVGPRQRGSAIDTSPRIKIDTTAPHISSLFALKKATSSYVAGETIYIVARFSHAVAVNESAVAAGLVPRLGLSVASEKRRVVAWLVDGTRDKQPFNVNDIPDFDLQFRAQVYDLLFRYDVEPGETALELRHSGRGAMFVEQVVELSRNETLVPAMSLVNDTNATNGTREVITYETVVDVQHRLLSLDAGSVGTILRASNGAMRTVANTYLRGTEDLQAVLGHQGSIHVEQQWKGIDAFAARIELVLSGLAHPHAGDLIINLTHNNVSVPIFGPDAGGARTLGRGPPPEAGRSSFPNRLKASVDAATAEQTSRQHWGAERGADYILSDTAESVRARNNLAPLGVATQSSTDHDGVASRAIDGNVDPYFTHESCTHTASEDALDGAPPWWQVRFAITSGVDQIGTIKIWNREHLEAVSEVQSVQVTDFLITPRGNFRLLADLGRAGVVGTAGFNGTSLYVRTDMIEANAPPSVSDELAAGEEWVGKSVQSILTKAWPELGSIGVSRYATEEPTLGGFIYLLTFLSYSGDLPMLRADTTNLTGYAPTVTVEETLKGSPSLYYSYDQDLDTITGVLSEALEFSAALYPCYVMIYDSRVVDIPDNLEDALSLSVWHARLEDTGDRERTIDVDPARFSASFDGAINIVRLQLDDDRASARLSFAEFQIFADREHTMSTYTGGSTIAARPWTAPFQSDSSLSHHFANDYVEGVWTLTITDAAALAWRGVGDKEYERKIPHGARTGQPGPLEAHGMGSLSEWVLVMTDEAGITNAYRVDITATVSALPKYGSLYADAGASAGRHISKPKFNTHPFLVGEFASLFDAGRESASKINASSGHERPLGPCYGVDTTSLNGIPSGIGGFRYCGKNHGVGNAMIAAYRREAGSKAEAKILRRQRVVYYHPYQAYVGLDAIDYSVAINSLPSTSSDATASGVAAADATGRVGIHVRECRRFDLDERTKPTRKISPLCPCVRSKSRLFGDETACLDGMQNVCRDAALRENWLRLCTACDDGAYDRTWCRIEIDRAATLVDKRGDCSPIAPPECRDELTSLDAPEPYVWNPGRSTATPHYDALRPLATANPGDGFVLPS
ncbi:hypothetical protein CTAYLR_002899 [Chrysophaeum taylorii]|uniref:YHYH domain-containing protein n=1 Tax=Chrysophaeum taylorii TaxID=2483200 RepID=A0AAD7UNI6_9STRA|nr:hypothetical protein CTAYLR_002899 [Chrysophaeum taylorii]